jgi:hypothetical protein
MSVQEDIPLSHVMLARTASPNVIELALSDQFE